MHTYIANVLVTSFKLVSGIQIHIESKKESIASVFRNRWDFLLPRNCLLNLRSVYSQNTCCGETLSLQSKMEDISEFSTSELDKSAYVRPFRLHYKQDGRNKAWDCVLTHHAVFVIVYNTSREKLVLVRQFRPSVYFNAVRLEKGLTAGDIGKKLDTSSVPASKGICIELCAGIIGMVNCINCAVHFPMSRITMHSVCCD